MTRAPTRSTAPTRVSRSSAPAPKKERATRASPLRTKRKKERKLAWIFLSILFLALLAVIVYVLWLPALRIQQVQAEGPDQEGLAKVAETALEGRILGILPRSSIFLIPEADVRARVLDAYPEVQAVSISAVGLNTLKVKALMRSNAFVWCGESIASPAPNCYEADAEGLVFAPYVAPIVGTSTATSTKPADVTGDLLVYGPLEGAGETPIRAHVTYASALPGALKFIKAMRGLGADIGSVTLRGDEIDLHTKAGTRITYVIGKEGEAAILAATSFPTLKLNDGSIEYIDLRFQNKVYLKRKGQAVE